MGVAKPVDEHITRSRTQLGDAEEFLDEGRVGKAAPLLWDSLEEALKAVAASRGLHLRSEANVSNFASALAETMGESSPFVVAFREAYFLYVDSFGYQLTVAQWQLIREHVAAGVAELLDLASGKVTR